MWNNHTFIELEDSSQIFENVCNVQLNVHTRPVEDEMFRVDGHNKRNLIIAFHIFANAPNNDKTTVDFSTQCGNLFEVTNKIWNIIYVHYNTYD